MAKNADLSNAKNAKKDEFYTQLKDINAEMIHYEKQFKEKTVLMNCDDPTWSNFWRYFHIEFERLGLKKIIATHYKCDEIASYKMEYEGGDDENFKIGVKTDLTQNGDFRSSECIDLLKEADIVVTNPPFSLFREYITLLMKHGKQFIIIGNVNALTYKEVFPLIKDNKVWFGASIHSGDRKFYVPDDYPLSAAGCGTDSDGHRFIRVKGVRWYTNMDYNARHIDLKTTYFYSKKEQLYPELYPKYDNYDAINVDKTAEIPMDYYEAMGVPITYMDKFNPEQFEIIGVDFDLTSPIELDNDKTGTGRFYVTREKERAFILSNRDTQEEIKNILINDIGVPENQIEYRNGVMGVPITFFDRYNPEQYIIIGLTASWDETSNVKELKLSDKHRHNPILNNENVYRRLLIKRKVSK